MALKRVPEPPGSAGRPKAGEPLEEGRQNRAEGRFYISACGGETLRELYLLFEKELSVAYDVVRGSLQTEPHPHLALLDFFEVYFRDPGKREPELAGVVGIYGESQPAEIQVSLASPTYSPDFLRVLGDALGKMIERRGGADIAVSVTENPSSAGSE